MRRLITILLFTVLSVCTLPIHAQLISVKTNALMDLLTVGNIDISVTTGNCTAVSVSVFGSQSVLGNKVKAWGVKPEFRYWIGGRSHTGWFTGLSVMGVSYDVNWKGEVYKGDALGGGLTLGYDFYLSKHWTLDVHGGFGAMYYHQQSHMENDKILRDRFKEKGVWTIPYDWGVSIVYIFR